MSDTSNEKETKNQWWRSTYFYIAIAFLVLGLTSNIAFIAVAIVFFALSGSD